MSLRFLVFDAYPRADRHSLAQAGATEGGRLFERLLKRLEPDASVDIVYPADLDTGLPTGAALEQYSGVLWTGSTLTIYHQDPRVKRQIELARACLDRGLPNFGSCWAAQLAVVATGGDCEPNPNGRELGIARGITLTDAGRAHYLYQGKPPVFDSLTCHADIITRLSPGAVLLAASDWSPVQAIAIDAPSDSSGYSRSGSGGGSFWAVQYHPEYDLHEIAALGRLRADELVAQGTFEDHATADRYFEELRAAERDPVNSDLREALSLTDGVTRFEERTREVANWIEHRVKPRAH